MEKHGSTRGKAWGWRLGLMLALLAPFAIAQTELPERSSDSHHAALTRVHLHGYAERGDAERDAQALAAAGIDTQILSDPGQAAYVISAGVFARARNAHQMHTRLRGLGYTNTALLPLGHTGNPVRRPVSGPDDFDGTLRSAESANGLWNANSADGAAAPEIVADVAREGVLLDASIAGQPQFQTLPRSREPLPPLVPTSDTRFSGFYQNEAAYGTGSPSHWQRFRHRALLSWDGRIDERLSWKLSGWAAYDPIFDLTDFYPREVREDRRSEAMLRETYLDIDADAWQFRLGRQHIIWGEMVGLFFADVVSAKDLREFVARDFELIRIPQWAARAEYFAGDLHGELVWIPYVTYDDIGVPGDDFFPAPPPVPGFGTQIRSPERPANQLDNSSFGARLSYLGGSWDLAGFYFGGYDLSPIFVRELITDPEPTAVFRPEHRRMHQVGLTASRDLGLTVAKAEIVYNRDRWFNVTRVEEEDGLVSQDFLDYILGLETVFGQGAQLNLQYFQRRFFDHDADIVPDRIESGASVYLSSWLPGPRLRPEFLWVHRFAQDDWMLRPRVTWEPPGDWRLTVGADLFGGPSDSLFGRFADGDRIYSELRLDF